MIARPRPILPWVVAAAILLALVPVIIVARIEHDGADRGALDALEAASPWPAALRGTDGGTHGAAVAESAAGLRPVSPLSQLAPPVGTAGGEPLVFDSGLFAGLPRAATVPLVMSGRVIDERGAPLAGARIVYLPDGATRELLRAAGPARLRNDELETLLPSVATAADGGFLLATTRAAGWLGMPGRDHERYEGPGVLVDDPRCAVFVQECGRSAAGEVDVGTLVVSAGAAVAGRVVDGSGRPLPGLDVSLSVSLADRDAPGGGGFLRIPERLLSATTNAAGGYAFGGLRPGRGSVKIATPGWRAAGRDVPAWSAGASVAVPDLVCDRGGTLAGVIRDSSGRPVPGAQAFVLEGSAASYAQEKQVPYHWNAWIAGGRRGGAPCADDGRFALHGLDDAACFVIAGAPGFRPAALRGAWPDAGDVSLTLIPDPDYGEDGVLQVLVVDLAGAPLSEARVRATTMRPGARLPASLPLQGTGPGAYTIREIGAAPVEVLVIARGFATTRVPLVPATKLGSVVRRVALSPESRVEGRVLDAAGRPVPDLAVLALPAETTVTDGRKAHGLTDAEGRFAIAGLGAGSWFACVAGADWYQPAPAPLELAEGEHRAGVVLGVARLGAIEGRVHCRDGTVERNRSSRGDEARVVLDPEPDEDGGRRWVTVDVDGRFRAGGLRPGTWVVRTFSEAEARAEIVPGVTTTVDLIVPKSPVVRGRVLAGDAPAAGVRVTSENLARRAVIAGGAILCGGIQPETALTDADGRFTLRVLGTGEFAVWALSPAGGCSPEAKVTLAADDEASVELHLPDGRIEGEVVDALTGAPVPGATVRNGAGFVTADERGHFLLAQMQAGKHLLWAKADGYLQTAFQTAVLGADAPLTGLRLAMSRAAQLSVTVLAPDGRTVGGEVVMLVWPTDPRAPSSGQSLRVEGGHGAIDGLQPGSYRVGIRRAFDTQPVFDERPLDEQFPDSVDVSLAAGETREVVLRVEPAP